MLDAPVTRQDEDLGPTLSAIVRVLKLELSHPKEARWVQWMCNVDEE
jgi:hypothetical protein